MFNLETRITEWTDSLREKGKLLNDQIAELESHLRDEIDDLKKKSLSEEEAFIIGIKRTGKAHEISKEFAKINQEIIWKDLTLYETDDQSLKKTIKDAIILALLCFIAGTLSKIPEFFGLISSSLNFNNDWEQALFFKNIGLFFVPCIACYFLYKKYFSWKKSVILGIFFIFSAFVINIYPQYDPYHTAFLTGLHLFIILWLLIGITYSGKNWGSVQARMNFLRFSGETFIYGFLLFCGVGVLTLLTIQIFLQIDIDIDDIYNSNIGIYLLFSVPIIASYLADTKKSIIENMAPILAKIFTPLFFITMLVFLGAVIFSGTDLLNDRFSLIIYNILLLLVLGLVIYSLSARKNKENTTFFDWLIFALIIVSIIIDVIVFSAIMFRINAYGFSANKTAAMGINILLLINLLGLAFYMILFFIKKRSFIYIEKWQTNYLYVYFAWAIIVAFLFPVIFGFI